MFYSNSLINIEINLLNKDKAFLAIEINYYNFL